MQPVGLVGKKPGGLHRRLLAVVQVAGEQQGVHLLVEAKVHDADKGATGRVADQVRKRGVAQRERAQRGVQVDVGGVDETEGQFATRRDVRRGLYRATPLFTSLVFRSLFIDRLYDRLLADSHKREPSLMACMRRPMLK